MPLTAVCARVCSHGVFALLIAGLLAIPAHSQIRLARRGGEFMVNTVTDGDQRRSRVIGLPDGGFMIVWQSRDNAVARRFDSATQPRGAEIQLNTLPNNSNPAPHIAATLSGAMLVVWESVTGDPPETGVLARRLTPSGELSGSPFEITDPDSFIGIAPSVGSVGNDHFLVAWMEIFSYRGRARIVSPAGSGPSFDVADGERQYDFAVSSSGSKRFQVVWYDESERAVIRGRSFIREAAHGEAVHLDTVTSLDHTGPEICTNPSGTSVVTWGTIIFDDTGTVRLIKYRFLDRDGNPSSKVLTLTPPENALLAVRPNVACGADQRFLLTWIDARSRVRVRGRLFVGDRRSPVSEFTIGLLEGRSSDAGATVAFLADGDVVVTWTDCGQPSGCDIFAQRLTLDLAADCPGDCNRDRQVTVDEVLAAVQMGLAPDDAALAKRCLAADTDLNYRATIDELVTAVNRALTGCSSVPVAVEDVRNFRRYQN